MEGRGFRQGDEESRTETKLRPAGRMELGSPRVSRSQFNCPFPPSVLPSFPSSLLVVFFLFFICLHHSTSLLTQKVNLSETGIFSHAAPTRPLTLVPPLLPPFFFFPILFSLFFSPLSLPSTDSTVPVGRSEGRNGLKTFSASFWFRRTTCFIQDTRLPVTTHLDVEHAVDSFLHQSRCSVFSQVL